MEIDNSIKFVSYTNFALIAVFLIALPFLLRARNKHRASRAFHVWTGNTFYHFGTPNQNGYRQMDRVPDNWSLSRVKVLGPGYQTKADEVVVTRANGLPKRGRPLVIEYYDTMHPMGQIIVTTPVTEIEYL